MTLDDVPAPTRERARHLILDGIGCALVGAKLPDSRKGFEGITALDDSGSAEIIGWGGLTTSALSAAMLNSSFIQGFEMDDFRPTAPLHSNSVVLPAMLGAGLAATGYVGIKRVFERAYGGCLAVFGEGHQPDATQISANLGSFWETDRITVKAYSAMGLLHAAIDAALELRTEGVTPDDVVSIDIDMPQAAYRHGGWKAERPLTPIGAQMNVAYAVAVALLDGKVLIDQFTADRIAGADVWNLIDRTMTRHEAKYDELPVTQRLTTRVAATLKDGSVRDKTVVHPRGSGDRLLTNDEIVEKYRDLTRTVVSAERQSAIESAILGLEDMADISELVALLTPTVRAATD
ncbi:MULTISPECIES: MmgE/PrpD family protein [unclassified Streptomyces]|uniref:MmgE/PrpD family protein n=1 Tax=unclassified Streptomyces TaxID=2593676 RepID=UPI0019675D04|nr:MULTISPECIES: MmgE/PrpD family protein [unclassified Streptomyces]